MPRMITLIALLLLDFRVLASVAAEISPAKVHVVYMTHFDAGFTDTTRNVCDRYFDFYFPEALQTAAALRKNCSNASASSGRNCPAYRWTQFPWLVAEYLDGLAGCAHRPRTPAEVAALEKGIEEDDVIWQANSLNFLTELLDPGLWDYSLKMRNKLNSKFSKRHGRIAGKLSDVTGMSRSVIPGLTKNGVRAMHVGYNGVGGLPIVMPNGTAFTRGSSFCGYDTGCPAEAVFLWQEPTTKEQIVMMIEDSYGEEIDLPLSQSSRASLLRSVVAPGHVMILHYTMDNTSPPSPKDIQSFWSGLERRFPDSQIVLSSLDDFVEDAFGEVLGASDPLVQKALARPRLPLVTAELGDSWLYGGAADPIKLATFREARRFLTESVSKGKVSTSSWQYDSYMRRLMKGPAEHNWGLSTGSVCADCRVNSTPTFGSTWPNAAFSKARYSAEYQRYDCPSGFSPGSARWGKTAGVCGYGPIEQEWAEQREWMHPMPSWSALRGWDRVDLSNEVAWNDFVHALESRLLPLRLPQDPNVANMKRLALPMAARQCGGSTLAFNAAGAVTHLIDQRGKQWSDMTHTLGQFRYVTYSHADFVEFAKEWNNHADDFDKPGMASANPESKTWDPIVAAAFSESDASSCHFVIEYTMPDEAHTKYGAPQRLAIDYVVPGTDGALMDITLVWRNKTATRLAESMWLSFVPKASDAGAKWWVDVLGYPIDPLDVVERGTRYKHAAWDGATLQDGSHRLTLRTLDTALIAPGDVNHLLRYSSRGAQPDPVHGGMHANLHNNLWGTAFPQWYDDDGIARFQVLSSSTLASTDVAAAASDAYV